MVGNRFVFVPYRGGAMVQVGSVQALRYYVEVADALLRCSLPAARGGLWARAARAGLVRGALTVAGRLLPGRASADLATLRQDVHDSWEVLRERSGRLPRRPDDLSALTLRRSAGCLVFVFGSAPDPLLVCKVPRSTGEQLDAEAATLQQLASVELVPRALGLVGRARVQEAMPGRPLTLRPLSADDAAGAVWEPQLTRAASAVQSIGELTGRRRRPGPFLELGPEAAAMLSPSARDRVAQAARRLETLAREVLCHGDLSPQNLLVSGEEVTGLIDWELARVGAPGTDVLNLAHSVFEQRLGLRRWREDEVAEAFATAWARAPLFTEGRRLAALAVTSSGMDAEVAADLEVAFYARRLHRRATRPDAYLTGAQLAARQLEAVCAS